MSAKYLLPAILFLSAVLFGCGAKEEAKTETAAETTATSEVNDTQDELHFKLDMIILNNLMVPVSIIEDLKKEEKSLYHDNYINSLDNAARYTDKFSQALNYGIYGMDVLYNAAHDHTAEIIAYKEKTLPIAHSLGLTEMYSETDVKKFLSVANDHSQLMDFIMEEYSKVDKFMVEQHEYNTLLLSLTGAIVESMYFTGMSIEETGISDLKYSLLTNERNILAQLIPLFDYFEGDEKKMALKTELIKIQRDLSSFKSREELTNERAKQLDTDIIALRTKIVNNEL